MKHGFCWGLAKDMLPAVNSDERLEGTKCQDITSQEIVDESFY